MSDRRWEVTIADGDSEDFEKEEIAQYEARVSASSRDAAKERAVNMIRERMKDVVGHRLVVTSVVEIWKPRLRHS